MELIFQNVQGRWIAEFELTADAAIHIEGVKEGDVSLWQRSTASGKYAFVRDSRKTPTYGTVYDYEIPALITPKFIKVECMTKPTFAEVISSGEITELKFQDKTVEVTNNGTTTITPDNGFAALNSVKVKTNVPQSGEGGGSASTVEYLDVTNVTVMNGQLKFLLLQVAYMGKVPQTVKVGNKTFKQGISPISSFMAIVGSFDMGTEDFTQAVNTITAISIDFSANINMQGQVLTIQEVFAMYGVQSEIDAIPRITEAEFYNLDVPEV